MGAGICVGPGAPGLKVGLGAPPSAGAGPVYAGTMGAGPPAGRREGPTMSAKLATQISSSW